MNGSDERLVTNKYSEWTEKKIIKPIAYSKQMNLSKEISQRRHTSWKSTGKRYIHT